VLGPALVTQDLVAEGQGDVGDDLLEVAASFHELPLGEEGAALDLRQVHRVQGEESLGKQLGKEMLAIDDQDELHDAPSCQGKTPPVTGKTDHRRAGGLGIDPALYQ